MTKKLITGDDIADILTFIALRARAEGLPEALATIAENLPNQLKSGPSGFYIMSLQLSVCGIC